MLDVDPLGLDLMDRKLLEAVIHRFDGGPVGLDNVAAAIGEERDTIEDVIEPYLIQQGYLQRTPRGRIATLAAYRHLGVTPPKNQAAAATCSASELQIRSSITSRWYFSASSAPCSRAAAATRSAWSSSGAKTISQLAPCARQLLVACASA